jgi:WhiB family redox-sensing transcriptional regulator
MTVIDTFQPSREQHQKMTVGVFDGDVISNTARCVETAPLEVAPLEMEVASMNWMDHAVCKGRTNLFFPPKAERPQARVRREAHARRLCLTCPVQAQCQVFARSNREYGYWGAESEEERHLAGFTVAAPIGVRSRAMRQAS